MELILGGFWEGKIGGVNAGTDIGAQGVHLLGFTKLNPTGRVAVPAITHSPLLVHHKTVKVNGIDEPLTVTPRTLHVPAEPLESEVDLHELTGLVRRMIFWDDNLSSREQR